MKIEAGKRYVTRAGEIRGPMWRRTDDADGCGGFTWKFPWACDERNSYRDDGSMSYSGDPHECDLVAEYVEPAPVSDPADAVIAAHQAYTQAVNDTLAEIRRARTLFPGDFNTLHEGMSIAREEFEELWDICKQNQKVRDPVKARKEALQLAAMAIRIAVECCTETAIRK